MKRKYIMAGIPALMLVFALILTGCENPSGGGGTYTPPVLQTQTYTSTSGGTTYKLVITERTSSISKAVRYAGKPGDSYTLTITPPGVTSTGTVQSVEGGKLTLKPSKSGAEVFVVTINEEKMTAITGTITPDEGSTTITAPGSSLIPDTPSTPDPTTSTTPTTGSGPEDLLPADWRTCTLAEWAAWRTAVQGGSLTNEERQSVIEYITAHYDELNSEGKMLWKTEILGYDYLLAGDTLTINFMRRGDGVDEYTPSDPQCDHYVLQNDANKGTFPQGKWVIASEGLLGRWDNEYLLFGPNDSFVLRWELEDTYSFDSNNIDIRGKDIPYTLNGNILKFNPSDSMGWTPSDPECPTWELQDDVNKGAFPQGKWVNTEYPGEYVIFGPSGTYKQVFNDEYQSTYTIDTVACKIWAKNGHFSFW